MVNYQKDVETEAKDFLKKYEDEIKEAIKEDLDFDRNNIDVLDSAFHESITDRGYTPKDAVFILENCENEETDSGLWEGLNDWQRELSTRAAYSYSLDVWFRCEEIYNEIKEEYEVTEDKDSLDEIFNRFTSSKLNPIEKGSQEEKELIKTWIRLNKEASWWGGYPVGSSYIDARSGSGHGMPEIKDFVDFDHEFARRVPHLSGKRKDAVKKYYKETFRLEE